MGSRPWTYGEYSCPEAFKGECFEPDWESGNRIGACDVREMWSKNDHSLTTFFLSKKTRSELSRSDSSWDLLGDAPLGGSPVNGMSSSPRAALLSAASHGRAENVQQLLEEGVGIEERDQHGRSALHEAARRGRRTVVQLLLDKGADVEATTMAGETPLHFAAQRRHREIVQLLLSSSARVDARTLAGYTPLHCTAAMEAGQESGGDWGTKQRDRMLAVVPLLLDKGADVEARTKNGQTAEDLTSAPGQEQVVALLRAAKRRAEREAFAMGHHQRLGAQSLIQGLDAGVVRLILDLA